MNRSLIKRSLPAPFLRLIRSYKNREFNTLSTQEILIKIYESGAWGKSKDQASPFYSGSGSNRADEIAAYVQSVTAFLSSFEVKPNIVDLGCGDFTVGSQVRIFC